MKAVLQRVLKASVTVEGKIVSSIGSGLLVLLGVEKGDQESDGIYLAAKTVEMRIFSDENGKMNKSVADIAGSILVVSQFTLLADWRKGRRPSFLQAAEPTLGNHLYMHFVNEIKKKGIQVEMGIFGADMQVELINDGPVTLILENQNKLIPES